MSCTGKNGDMEIKLQLKSNVAEEIINFASAADSSIHLSKSDDGRIKFKAESQGKTALFDVTDESETVDEGGIPKYKIKNLLTLNYNNNIYNNNNNKIL